MVCQIQLKAFLKWRETFTKFPKWQKFAKSGHTDCKRVINGKLASTNTFRNKTGLKIINPRFEN